MASVIFAVYMTRMGVQISQNPYERPVNIRQQIPEKKKNHSESWFVLALELAAKGNLPILY